MSRYSIKSSAGKGLIGFVTTLNIAGEFDPAWLDSNPQSVSVVDTKIESATQHGWTQTVITAGWGQVNRILLLLYLMSAIPLLTYCAYKCILAGFEEGNGE